MARRASLRWRFLAAFGAISGFSVVAAIGGLWSIALIGDALEQITEARTPVAIESLQLSRHVERVVTAAASLLSAPDVTASKRISDKIERTLNSTDELLADLGKYNATGEDIAAIASLIDRLRVNLGALRDTLDRRQRTTARKIGRLQDVEATSLTIRRLLTPGLTILEARITQRRAGVEDSRLAAEIADLTAVQEAEFARAAVKDALMLSASAESAPDLDLLGFPLKRALAQLRATVPRLDPILHKRISREIAALEALVHELDGVPSLRRQELALTAVAEGHLEENTRLSDQLRIVVDRLLASVDAAIATAQDEVHLIQRNSTFLLIGVVLVSVIVSALIVWLYVDRNLLARLTVLSRSMLAVADGNLRIPIVRSGRDEIADMADALTLFRDTAIEIEEKNLRRADEFLNVILPPSAAEELKVTGKVEPRGYNDVAIVFTDIVGFTRYCEHRNAHEIVSALDLFARRSEQIIREEGLEKIKTVGDGLLMTCNLLRSHDDPVMAALSCAQRLNKAAREPPLDWRLRSGVHFGSVVGGLIGKDKFTFDIWGDAVNVASRLSDLDYVEICLSEAAWEQIRDRQECHRKETVDIKGHNAINAYFLDTKRN